MSRSVTRVVSIAVVLVTMATVSVLGSRPSKGPIQRPVVATNLATWRLHPLVPEDVRRPEPTPAPTPTPPPPPAPAAQPAPVAIRPALPAPKPPPPPVSTVGGAAGVQLSLMNQDRAANGVAPLAWSAALARVAQYRAQDMLNRGYFSHYDPSTGQLAFVELFHLWGISYTTAGENIAWSTNPSMAAINTMFMSSPEHRANILNGAYHRAGVGVASNGAKVMVVEVFSN
jgi:uncharacterized protein YkwD